MSEYNDIKTDDDVYEVKHLPLDGTEASDGITHWIKHQGSNKISYSNGDSFQGFFNNEKLKHGLGTYVWIKKVTNDDGESLKKEVARFEGLYVNGVKNGHGKLIFPNKDVYEGNFKDGKVHDISYFTYIM